MDRFVPAPLIVFGCLVLSLLASAPVSAGYPLPPEYTGRVYVSSYGTNEVVCYSADGTFLFRFEHAELRGPRGLAFAPGGELYVGSQSSDRVMVFTRDGTYRRQIRVPELDGPTSLAFSPDGRLYVASFQTDDVLVFENDELVDQFTGGSLNGPNCIAFGPDGGIYVASQLTNHVVRFSATGEFEEEFSGGGLSSPMGVAIYGDRLYVTGGASHSVAVFELDGTFIENLPTSPPIPSPQGIAFDTEGRYITTSFSNGGVARFDRSGEVLTTFDSAGIRTARSVAFEPLGAPAAFARGDFNEDGSFDLSDAVAVLAHLFLGNVRDHCPDAGDSNDDGALDVSDAVHVLNYLFLGGTEPPPPFPDEGDDPTPDELECRDAV